MSDLISVIVPVYNVETYLKECIDSILKQSYSNLEIILVDDGSTDNSGLMCDEYQKEDSRIMVLHQKNEGLSAARNAGMACARGEYIGFVDSDDLIHPQMYELLMSAIQQENADAAICREFAFFKEEELPGEECHSIDKRCLESADRQEYCNKFLDDFTGPTTWAWNKLYKAECLKGILFPVGKRMEDIIFSSDIAKNISKVVWIPERLYYYRQRKGSIMNSGNPRILTEHGEALVHSYHVLKKLGDEKFSAKYRKNIIGRLAGLEADAYKLKCETERKELRMLASTLYKQKNGSVGVKNSLARYFPYAYYFLKNRMQ